MSFEYAVDVRVGSDGVMTATSDDIRGLVLETTDLREMCSELLLVSERLLRSNHGLTDQQVADAELHVNFKKASGQARRPRAPHPRVLFADVSGLLEAA